MWQLLQLAGRSPSGVEKRSSLNNRSPRRITADLSCFGWDWPSAGRTRFPEHVGQKNSGQKNVGQKNVRQKNRKRGMGNGEWGMGGFFPLPTPHCPLPVFLSDIFQSPLPSSIHSLLGCPSTNSMRILSCPSMNANLILPPATERISSVTLTPSLRSFSKASGRFATLNPTWSTTRPLVDSSSVLPFQCSG